MNHPQEPSADIRQTCSVYRQLYVALLMEGFDQQQALIILGYIIQASMGRQ